MSSGVAGSLFDDHAGEALVVVAETRPGTGGIAAELSGHGLVTLAIGLGELQLVGHLTKPITAARAAMAGDPTGLRLLALEVHGRLLL